LLTHLDQLYDRILYGYTRSFETFFLILIGNAAQVLWLFLRSRPRRNGGG
jgi:hypothetical protein